MWPSLACALSDPSTRIDVLSAIARLKIQFAPKVAKLDGTSAGAQIHPPFPWQVNFAIHPVASRVQAHNADVVGKMNSQFDRVP